MPQKKWCSEPLPQQKLLLLIGQSFSLRENFLTIANLQRFCLTAKLKADSASKTQLIFARIPCIFQGNY